MWTHWMQLMSCVFEKECWCLAEPELCATVVDQHGGVTRFRLMAKVFWQLSSFSLVGVSPMM